MAKRRTKAKPKPVEPLVNAFAHAQGDYRHEPMAVTAGELGSTKPGNVRVLRNRGGSTVERWIAANSLNPGQIEAITLYARAWRLFIGEQRVVANWSLAGHIRGMMAADWVDGFTEAKKMVEHIDKVVLGRVPTHYLDCWKNVVLFDEAAGIVGARLGFANKPAEAAAKAIVLLIADMIAGEYRLGCGA